MAGDPYKLQRFVDAQANGIYEQALAELHAGRKRSHWIWFIFPQHVDLGRSPTAKYYGLNGVAEARAYLAHPLLAERLKECCSAVLPHLRREPAEAVLGSIDALKLRSSIQLFAEADCNEALFGELLEAATAS